jgi:hypothetical protein
MRASITEGIMAKNRVHKVKKIPNGLLETFMSLLPKFTADDPDRKITVSDYIDDLLEFPRTPQQIEKEYEEFYLPIFFQVFYTLAVFSEIGLVHNDLHTGNVFVDNVGEYALTPSRYFVNNTFYEVPTAFQARIFDWDRSEKFATAFDPMQTRNTLLTPEPPLEREGGVCAQQGQCGDTSQRSDIFTFLWFINDSIGQRKNRLVTDLMEKIVPKGLLNRLTKANVKPPVPGETLIWLGRLCTCVDEECDYCNVVQDSHIKTPKEILALPEFDVFKKQDGPGDAFVWTMPSEAGSAAIADWRLARQL